MKKIIIEYSQNEISYILNLLIVTFNREIKLIEYPPTDSYSIQYTECLWCEQSFYTYDNYSYIDHLKNHINEWEEQLNEIKKKII